MYAVDEPHDQLTAGTHSERGAISRPREPRVPLLDLAALPEEQRGLAGMGASPNVLRVLGHRPDLLTSWLQFGMQLTTAGRLPPRTRELAILRLADRTTCEYEWANHVLGALTVGIAGDDIAALIAGTGSWTAAEAAALNLVDDLCADDCASEATWHALKESYDDGAIMELVLLIGFYRMTAGFLNSLGVPAEPGRPPLGTVVTYEAPTVPRPPRTSVPGASAHIEPDGTWQLKIYHPAGTQELRLVIAMDEGTLAGTLINDAAGLSVPVTDGKLDANRLSFTTVMTSPYPVSIDWDGTIDGDTLAGTADIRGQGAFPFEATRP
jgi:4-carboxymuconolactone decarboxylase